MFIMSILLATSTSTAATVSAVPTGALSRRARSLPTTLGMFSILVTSTTTAMSTFPTELCSPRTSEYRYEWHVKHNGELNRYGSIEFDSYGYGNGFALRTRVSPSISSTLGKSSRMVMSAPTTTTVSTVPTDDLFLSGHW